MFRIIALHGMSCPFEKCWFENTISALGKLEGCEYEQFIDKDNHLICAIAVGETDEPTYPTLRKKLEDIEFFSQLFVPIKIYVVIKRNKRFICPSRFI